MDIVRPMAFGLIIVAGLLLLGCEVKFQRNSQHLHLRSPIYPNESVSPDGESRQYDFEIAQANFGGILMPNANGEQPDEHVDMGLKRFGYARWELSLARAKDFPEVDLRHDEKPQVLRFAEKEVIPYFGHLFRFTFNGESVHLEECTQQFPSELVPSARSRVLTMNGSEATIFRKQVLQPNDAGGTEDRFEKIQLIKIETHPEGTRATILRQKMTARSVDGVYETEPLEPSKEEWIGVGANLMVDDQLVRVKQIVPSVEMDGVGTPVGWIELELVDISQVEMHRAIL